MPEFWDLRAAEVRDFSLGEASVIYREIRLVVFTARRHVPELVECK
jgi:hypothetical protein